MRRSGAITNTALGAEGRGSSGWTGTTSTAGNPGTPASTVASISASATTRSLAREWTFVAAHAASTTSGPTPAGSPQVIASTGRMGEWIGEDAAGTTA